MDFDDDDVTTMPLVLTQKHGGEYDDEAFGAGWHLGILDARLTLSDMAGLIVPPLILRDKWKQQADLIAMSRGMIVKITPLEEQPGYSVYVFAPADAFQSDDEDL